MECPVTQGRERAVDFDCVRPGTAPTVWQSSETEPAWLGREADKTPTRRHAAGVDGAPCIHKYMSIYLYSYSISRPHPPRYHAPHSALPDSAHRDRKSTT